MSSNLLAATQLIAVLTAYCATFCPLLCWVIRGTAVAKRPIPVLTANPSPLR
jgi:hypothetical protein